MNCFIGIDLGGTSVKGMLYTENKEWSDIVDTPTKNRSANEIISDISGLITNLLGTLDNPNLKGIGIGVPGIADENGTVKMAPNLKGWTNIALGQKLNKQFSVPVKVNNDANVAALGEAYFGATEPFNNMLFLTLGTGIGAGIIINGNIHTGAQGFGGEAGHMVISPEDGNTCGCGKVGCLETCFSATAVIREGKKAAKAYPASKINEVCANDIDSISAKTVFDAAKEGDSFARAILEKGTTEFARGVANICMLLDPETIILGGGVTLAGDYLLDMLRPKIHAQMTFKGYTKPDVIISDLQHTAGIKGAVALAIKAAE
ncbi:MAG: ROK family protein [Fibrobacterales bacterium]